MNETFQTLVLTQSVLWRLFMAGVAMAIAAIAMGSFLAFVEIKLGERR